MMRQDGRHSPEAVLRGVLGRTYPRSGALSRAVCIEYQATTLSEYGLRTSPDHKRIEAVKNPRRIETHFVSLQLHLWQSSETEWLLARRLPERHRRQLRRTPSNIVQLRFPEFHEVDQAL